MKDIPSLIHDDLNNTPLVLWHGTCAKFDTFYPLSQFAVDKYISDSSQFYTQLRHPPKERFQEGTFDKLVHKELMAILSRTKKSISDQRLKKRPDFKIIPVHLKMRNPLILSCFGFDLDPNLSGLIWAILKKRGKNLSKEKTSVYSDFIFKDSYQISTSKIQKELALGHLFSYSENEEDNHYHLAAQRFIFFMEKMGYDGILYDEYMKNSVDAYREGKISTFDGRSYVIFHPDQAIRLDKKIDVPTIRPSTRDTIELDKIFYQYQKKYQPQKIDQREQLCRLEFFGCIKNEAYSR